MSLLSFVVIIKSYTIGKKDSWVYLPASHSVDKCRQSGRRSEREIVRISFLSTYYLHSLKKKTLLMYHKQYYNIKRYLNTFGTD